MTKINFPYVKSRKGALKIIELVATILAFSTMIAAGNGLTYLRNETYYSRYDFFLATHVIGCLVSLIISLVHTLSMQDILGTSKIWSYLNLVFCSLLTVLCGASAGLMIVYAENEHQSLFYKINYPTWRRYTGLRISAITFGFVSSVFYSMDAVFQFIELS
ncbi:uncharacterized protein LOC110248788 [Exaiptasia diaphana]|uniref:MARVEL domain-containing protein n=1 Tax=Exaiptasia diaphana TaxID=2652724 RepID=A0A913XWP0_EXADI|nr:uncharacterized protein LOC110248788 [Exaiptasia diaphana]